MPLSQQGISNTVIRFNGWFPLLCVSPGVATRLTGCSIHNSWEETDRLYMWERENAASLLYPLNRGVRRPQLSGTTDSKLFFLKKEEAVVWPQRQIKQEVCLVDIEKGGLWMGGGVEEVKTRGREQTRTCFHWVWMFRKHLWPPPLAYSYLISWGSTVKSEGCVTALGSVSVCVCVCVCVCLLYRTRDVRAVDMLVRIVHQ